MSGDILFVGVLFVIHIGVSTMFLLIHTSNCTKRIILAIKETKK